jgi:hypothetical protein
MAPVRQHCGMLSIHVHGIFRDRSSSAFSLGRGESYPISQPGRVIFLFDGMAVFVDGLARLLAHTGRCSMASAIPLVVVVALMLLPYSKFVRGLASALIVAHC